MEMPAPTAASVNATSAASSKKKLTAINRLNIPINITATNKLEARMTAPAVMTKSDSRKMLKTAIILASPVWALSLLDRIRVRHWQVH